MATTNPQSGTGEDKGQTSGQQAKAASKGQAAQQGAEQGQAERGAAGTQRQGGGLARRGSGAALGGALGTWGMSPFSLLRRMMEDLDRMFDDFGQARGGGGRELQRGTGSTRMLAPEVLWVPEVDVFERGGNLMVRADLPGLRKEDVRITVTDDALVLEGERRREVEEERGGLYRAERTYGSFRRAIPLPEGADADKAEARFDNGVLEIRLPLPKERERGRRIEIKGGAEAEGSVH